MRLRFAVLASLLAAVMTVAAGGVATAAPHHNNGLTINVTPNPINAGDGVLIYGQLNASPVSGQTIVLYHHVADSHQGYTVIGRTTTDGTGFYEFPRAEGVVTTNRSWFAREQGGQGVHSRTVYERVAALVTMTPSTLTQDTNHAVVFAGHVTPDHGGGPILLQVQNSNTGNWTTIERGRLNFASNYSIAHRWRRPGIHDVRAVFPGDDRNVAGQSDPATITIEQAQVPGFTITSSAPVIPEGSSVMITGVLDRTDAAATPLTSTSVTLFARLPDQNHFTAIASAVTGTGGGYRFVESPSVNTVYQVRTTLAPIRHTALLFQGVRDVLTMTASTGTATAGETVNFAGTVSPTTKVGHWVYLEQLGDDGDWHSIEAVRVLPNSRFHFSWRFGEMGVHTLRARIYSDEHNVGAASPPVMVTVMGVATVPSLPPPS